jgi:hypothetical protein
MTEAGLTYNQTLQLCIVEEQQVELDLQRASELHSILPHTAEVKTYQINLAEGYQTEPPLAFVYLLKVNCKLWKGLLYGMNTVQ